MRVDERGEKQVVWTRLALRIMAAVLVGVAFSSYEDFVRAKLEPQPSDFVQPLTAARLLVQHQNPYREIGPTGSVHHQFHLIYPATAALAAMPFTWVSLRVANALFVGLGAALLMWALTRETLLNPQLLLFISIPMVVNAQTVQWAPWLTSAVFFPTLGFVYACKPSVGAAYLFAYPNPRTVAIALLFTLVSLLMWPWWPGEWVPQLHTVTHMSAPVSRPGGLLLLLAALRWRRPEARLLLGLSAIPQTPVAYEVLPLFLLVSTIGEGVSLWLATVLLVPVVNSLSGKPYDEWMALSGQWLIWIAYVPALLLVLRRPNVAPVDDPLTNLIGRLSRSKQWNGWLATQWNRLRLD